MYVETMPVHTALSAPIFKSVYRLPLYQILRETGQSLMCTQITGFSYENIKPL